HLVIEFARLGEESLEASERVTQKSAGSVEVLARKASESDGARLTGPETDLALSAVVKEYFAVGRLMAARQGRRPAPATLHPRHRDLDVLARAERIRGEIRARAVISPASRPRMSTR